MHLHQNFLDTDGDGTADFYDLESDGDGCSDVIEAGFTDSESCSGILGASPPTVNQFGLVSGYDGYVVPNDADLTGVYDFQEVGSAALPANIITQPNAQAICLGIVRILKCIPTYLNPFSNGKYLMGPIGLI